MLPYIMYIPQYKDEISADNIGRYIGYDLLISVISVSVKFNRYANPACILWDVPIQIDAQIDTI